MGDPANPDVVDTAARNYYRLARLTLIAGTDQIRRCVIDRLPAGRTIHTELERSRNKLNDLYQRRIVTEKQMQVLYPPDNNADLSRIDITLWIVLLRNLLSLAKLGVSRKVEWNEAPPGNQTEWYHDVLRIRETRNNLSHLNRPELDDDSFENLWNYTASALRRLDQNIDVDEYRNTSLDRQALRAFHQQVNEQVLQEKNAFLQEELEQRRRLVYYILLFVVIIIAIIAGSAVALVLLLKSDESCLRKLQNVEVLNKATLDFMPRDGWTNVPPDYSQMDKLQLPVPYVIYTHTADTGQCAVTQECCSQILNIQYMHMHSLHRHWADIAHHYMIDSRGVVYEARDIHYKSAAVYGWNNRTVSVALVGNFMHTEPQMSSLGAFDLLLDYLVEHGFARRDFTLYAMCEMRDTDSPGIILYKKLITLCADSPHTFNTICQHLNYSPGGKTFCYFNYTITNTCDESCYYL